MSKSLEEVNQSVATQNKTSTFRLSSGFNKISKFRIINSTLYHCTWYINAQLIRIHNNIYASKV